jgi:hypothetical protein
MALEKDAGDVSRWVESYVSHLTSQTGGEFRTLTRPGAEDLSEAIETAASEIISWLAEAGYSANPATYSDLALSYLSFYNAVGAAYRLELMHPGLGFGNNPNSRWENFYNILQDLRKRIMDEGVAGIGIAIAATMQGQFTSESDAAKQLRTDDIDKTKPLFTREMFRHPEITDPVL